MVKGSATGAVAAAAMLLAAGPATAADEPPGNVGAGLRELMQPAPKRDGFRVATSKLVIRDRAGRVLVDVYARDDASLSRVRTRTRAQGLRVLARDSGAGALEGFVAVGNVDDVAATRGVASVAAVLRPHVDVGAATTQGVAAQRIDRIDRKTDGKGITVGALSDSFDNATEDIFGNPLTIHAKQDVRTGDLPKHVTVIEDDEGLDEGRAMLQIVHDIAPRARECFATANTGQVGFADNIRRLADPRGRCGADVIVDDVHYFAEPMFSDGIVGDAVDEVAARGVHYFSSAGNGSDQQSYAAPLRIVSPQNATAGTNIKLAGVDPALYSGGFQDFDPGSGTDIAQNMSARGLSIMSFQWDDPFDPNGPDLGDPLVSASGELTAGEEEDDYTFQGTGGQTILAVVDGVPSGSTDVVIELRDAAGNVLVGPIDTGTSPEQIVATLPADGTYTLAVMPFEDATGPYTVDVRPVLSETRTTTDLNVLLFNANGNFLGAFADMNRISGQPLEVPAFVFNGPMQLVISKAGTGGNATQIRYGMFDELQYDEYNAPFSPSVFGHSLARGATAVAAYDPFRPLLPEEFTSVGGDLPVYWDSQGNPYRRPSIRRVPQVAATNGGNTTFFVSDTPADPDSLPNFFGTSASAPHAAGIAALMLDARGGPRSMGPGALRARLEDSTFRHDLDQQHASGGGGGLSISADGDQGNENATTPGAMDDRSFFRVSYDGPGSVVRLTFDGATANPSGLPGPGARSAGIVFDPRPFLGPPFGNQPGLFLQGFPFTVGSLSGGLSPSDVTASFSRPGVGDATSDQFQRMTLSFAPGSMRAGRALSFGIDRDDAITPYPEARDGNGADELGGIALYPERAVLDSGLGYTAALSDGNVLRGQLQNRIGRGWTPVDGYGLIDAEEAVEGR
jgi:hypothetical protein